jgi:RecA-family ATPase
MFHPDGRPVLPGQDHAQAVAAALSGVAKVRVLDLSKVWPDMPAKGDVSDWLDNGGSAEALYELVDGLPDWTPNRPNGVDHDPPLPKLVPLRFVEGEIPKPREWIVHDGWIPTRKVTLLQGDGGDGKTSLLQQLLSSCATALPWIGLRAEECTGLGFFTEDEDVDLRLRQADIDASYGQHCASTGKMHLFPRVDLDNELVVFDRIGNPTLTPFYKQVRESALDLRARLVALDVAIDLYGGDEIIRRQVRAFMRPLGALAREIDGAVVVTGHLSQAGIKSDGGHSGSTDWSNAVRSRLYLGRPKADNGEPTDQNARVLARKKANFATVGDTVKLHWARGVILPDEFTPSQFRRSVDDVFMTLLDAHEGANRKPLSESKNAPNYAPRVFARAAASERDGYGEPDFARTLERLFRANKIASVDYGRKGDERKKIMRKIDDEEQPK